MSAAWDSSPALSPVPWGERSREAFNCVPGDQQSAPLVNSFGVRDGAEPVDHRGGRSRAEDERPKFSGVANRSRVVRASAWSRASAGLLIVGSLSQRARAVCPIARGGAPLKGAIAAPARKRGWVLGRRATLVSLAFA
jgi:hypothetical protein